MEKAFLPPDMLYYVLRFLPALSVGPWALVCKEMRDMVKSEFRRRRCKKLIAYRCELAKEYTHIISPWAFSDAHTVQWHQGGFMFTRQWPFVTMYALRRGLERKYYHPKRLPGVSFITLTYYLTRNLHRLYTHMTVFYENWRIRALDVYIDHYMQEYDYDDHGEEPQPVKRCLPYAWQLTEREVMERMLPLLQ